jgi:hypothetical protein
MKKKNKKHLKQTILYILTVASLAVSILNELKDLFE